MYSFPYINGCSYKYKGGGLEDAPYHLESYGFNIIFFDLKTTHSTTKFKVHGQYVIVASRGSKFYLFSGSYNHICALEGAYSMFEHAQMDQAPASNDMKRWSKWDNPMHNLKNEAWDEMLKYTRCFNTLLDVKEYIKIHMKNWEDVGTTLVWARGM